MKETLRAQQQLLQKLYAELDQEREASATAASEAMDMILRLQGEKAAVKMEASHYKRMAEEKIGHAEATLEFFEELMLQKEMEIASLEFQVSAYKHKLLTLGADFNASEFEFPADLLLNGNDQQQNNGENSQTSTVRRLTSLPPIQFKNTLRSNRNRDRSPTPIIAPAPTPDVIPNTIEGKDQEVISPSSDFPNNPTDFTYGTLDSYWNQIQKLDEKVNKISNSQELGVANFSNSRLRRRSCSIFSQASKKYRLPPTNNADKENHLKGAHGTEQVSSPSCSANVYDVFEVPQTNEKHEVKEQGRKRLEKWISDVDNRLIKPDSMSEDFIESNVKHDIEKLKSDMLSTHHEIKKSNHKDDKNVDSQRKEGMNVDCNAQAEFHKLHQRIDRLERETIRSIRQEIKHEGDGEEHLRLLKYIQSQLHSIQSEMMKNCKTTKASPMKEEISLAPLQEIIYFLPFLIEGNAVLLDVIKLLQNDRLGKQINSKHYLVYILYFVTKRIVFGKLDIINSNLVTQ